jgi:hypothetical protein
MGEQNNSPFEMGRDVGAGQSIKARASDVCMMHNRLTQNWARDFSRRSAGGTLTGFMLRDF